MNRFSRDRLGSLPGITGNPEVTVDNRRFHSPSGFECNGGSCQQSRSFLLADNPEVVTSSNRNSELKGVHGTMLSVGLGYCRVIRTRGMVPEQFLSASPKRFGTVLTQMTPIY